MQRQPQLSDAENKQFKNQLIQMKKNYDEAKTFYEQKKMSLIDFGRFDAKYYKERGAIIDYLK